MLYVMASKRNSLVLCALLYASFITADGCQGGSRRKRSVAEAPEVNSELSDFFTTCLHPIVSLLFPSTRSVVDFSIRDTIWYREVESNLCTGSADVHECWIGAVLFLIDTGSVLYEPTKQCICDWADDCPREVAAAYRRKRQACVSAAPSQHFLLTEVDLAFSECIDNDLENDAALLISYPSLNHYDGESVSLFLVGHYSYCRPTVISSSSFDFTNVDEFTQNSLPTLCPRSGANAAWRNNLVDTMSEVTRQDSPVWDSYTVCASQLASQGDVAFVGNGPCNDQFAGCEESKCYIRRIMYIECRKTCAACT
ncbi:uncharacterized protein LOC120332849 [Styela clava]